MYRMLMCDDDKVYREKMIAMIYDYAESSGIKIQIDEFKDGSEIVELTSCYDGYFLDIRMKYLDGLRAADEILKRDNKATIVFMSSFNYVNDTYIRKTAKYYFKPMSMADVSDVVDEIIRRTDEKQRSENVWDQDGNPFNIKLTDIVQIYVQRRKTVVETKNEIYTTKTSFDDMKETLRGFDFVHTYYRTLVNMRHIEKVMRKGAELVMHSGGRKQNLQTSRDYKQSFYEQWLKYISEEG